MPSLQYEDYVVNYLVCDSKIYTKQNIGTALSSTLTITVRKTNLV